MSQHSSTPPCPGKASAKQELQCAACETRCSGRASCEHPAMAPSPRLVQASLNMSPHSSTPPCPGTASAQLKQPCASLLKMSPNSSDPACPGTTSAQHKQHCATCETGCSGRNACEHLAMAPSPKLVHTSLNMSPSSPDPACPGTTSYQRRTTQQGAEATSPGELVPQGI